MNRAAAVAAALFALLVVACEKPDASYVTSPSVLALLGTTEGTVAYLPPEEPPDMIADSEGWTFDLGNARYEELENFTPSIQVVALLVSGPAARMEMWIADGESAAWRWEAGPAAPYSGTLCFQIALVDEGEAVPLNPGTEYTLTIAFFDDGDVPLAVRSVRIAGTTPNDLATKPLPGEESRAGRVALACPRAPL